MIRSLRRFFRRRTQRNPNFLNWYFVIGLGESGICIANSNELCLSGKAAQLDTILPPPPLYYYRNVESIAKKLPTQKPLTTILKKKIPWNQFHEIVIVLFEFEFPWMHKIFWNFTKKKAECWVHAVFSSIRPWWYGIEVRRAPKRLSTLKFFHWVRKDEIDDNDGDDSVTNVPLKFQGLEHDDSISKWKNLHPALSHC